MNQELLEAIETALAEKQLSAQAAADSFLGRGCTNDYLAMLNVAASYIMAARIVRQEFERLEKEPNHD